MAIRKRVKYRVISMILPCVLMFLTVGFMLAIQCIGTLSVYAEGALSQDGIYSVSVSNDMTMGGSYLSSTAQVEKITNGYGTHYYASFTFDTSGMTNPRLIIDGKTVGYEITASGGNSITYRYTLSYENLSSSLPFTVYISAMGRDASFNATLNLSGASYIGAGEDTETERPAEFVPVISTSAASSYQASYGTNLVLPSATAVLGSEDCEVTLTAYYGNEVVEVTKVKDGGYLIALDNIGEYTAVYRAESASYTTLSGSNSFAEYTVQITSSAGEIVLAKFTDANGVLSDGAALQAGKITGGTTYDLAAEKMSSIADNFEVYSLVIYNSDGSIAQLTESLTLYIMADSTYDRNEIVVYHMTDDGEITKLSSSGYGRYVKFDSAQTGIFIVCIPGVAFTMPMWGYALIAAGCVVIIACAVTVPVILHKKRKKQKTV